MSDKKEIKLTNFQVPRSPEGQKFDTYKQAPEIDLTSDKYRDVGKVHNTQSVQDVAERMMQKREAATGISINKTPEEAPQVNLKGVVDERPKEFWTPPRIGKR
jgi:hypothetical protein